MLDDTTTVLLGVTLALTLWATVRIARSALPLNQKLVKLFACWLMPLVGPIAMLVDVPRRGHGPGVQTGARRVDTVAPEHLELPGRAPFSLQEHLQDGNGFLILDWRALETWANQDDAPDVALAATGAGRRAWLTHLRDGLPTTHLLETHDAWVLSSYEPRLAFTVGEFVSKARSRISRLLAGVARFSPDERTIFIAFDDHQDYYRYVANYYPDEGEFSTSGGMYINAGCPHFVTVKDELWRLEPVIAHELTHSAVAHLKLPLWLDEGIAVTTEDHVTSKYSRPHREHLEQLGKHLGFWNAERMQEFWSGESFHRTDEGHGLSYDLAHQIVGLLGREWSSFAAFANGAQRADGGAAAARTALNLDLGELAAAALRVAPQPGWSPDPGTWKRAPAQR